eukprot:gb/GECH01013700.1/.p1 GENE.gb/GECH01013700.1/~~gb/GECH01013700.1/.p1  ORF type:complete len:465 (+),score=108.54 gb/GECH01013700.1/:1-1395(+)
MIFKISIFFLFNLLKNDNIFFYLEKWENSLIYFSRSLDLNPLRSKAYLRRAQIYELYERFKSAQEEYSKCLSMLNIGASPSDFDPEYHQKIGDEDPSLNDGDNQSELTLSSVLLRMGRCSFEIGEMVDSLSYLNSAIEEHELITGDALFWRGSVKEKLGYEEKAMQDFGQICQEDPLFIQNKESLAKKAEKEGKFSESMNYYYSLIKINPKNESYRYQLACISLKYVEHENYSHDSRKLGIQELSQYVENVTTPDSELLARKGWLHYHQNELEKAIKDFTHSLSNDRDCEMALEGRAYGNIKLGSEIRDIVKDLEKLIELDDYHGFAHKYLAKHYYGKQKYSQSLTHYVKAWRAGQISLFESNESYDPEASERCVWMSSKQFMQNEVGSEFDPEEFFRTTPSLQYLCMNSFFKHLNGSEVPTALTQEISNFYEDWNSFREENDINSIETGKKKRKKSGKKNKKK